MAKLITTLSDGTQADGRHEVEFNGKGLPSGVYYYSLRSGDFHVKKNWFYCSDLIHSLIFVNGMLKTVPCS